MDFSDKATQHEEMMRDIALRNAANHPPELQATGVCRQLKIFLWLL